MPRLLTRREWLLAVGAAAALPGCSLFTRSGHPARAGGAHDPHPPIVFAHGNGDTSALWISTVWRFESNGWPRDRLFALDLPYPLARDDESRAQPGRSSIDDYMHALSATVDRALGATGAQQAMLIGNSRGGLAIRHYIENGGGASKVSRAILGGAPNHGVWADPDRNPGNEFNGAGTFLERLNAPRGPDKFEVTPGVAWMTIRSDRNDKYAQPDGAFIGMPGVPTHVSYDGPALRGADNVVLPGVDHRETSFSSRRSTPCSRS